MAQEHWQIEPVSDPALFARVFAEDGVKPGNGLPDGGMAHHGGGGDIVSAWYGDPTTRYRHAILGDAIEAATLWIRAADGSNRSVVLPETEVFEDRTPRLVDLDGDGTIEVVTIRSSQSAGASVTVYGLVDGNLAERASTGFIGRANRWLNIAGIADFRGTGRRDIAFVRTPHIGGTLFVYAFSDGGLKQIARADGYSNHEIGSREMRLSAIADVDGDGRQDLALPSDDRRTLHVLRLGPEGLHEIGRADLPARIDKAIGVERRESGLRLLVGLDNGATYAVNRPTR